MTEIIPKPYSPVDIAPFADVVFWTGDSPDTLERHSLEPQFDAEGTSYRLPAVQGGATHLGLEWEEPRDFTRVVVRYRKPRETPLQDQVKLQYWNHYWPQPDRGGWTSVEDSFHGRWITGHHNVRIEGSVWTHTFDPLDITEIDRAADCAVCYRRGKKIRLLFRDIRPEIAAVEVYADSLWQEQSIHLLLGAGQAGLGDWSGSASVYNGYLLDVESDDCQVEGPAWKGRGGESPGQVRLKVLAADTKEDAPHRTIVTVKTHQASFSFLPSDLAAGPLWIRDLGVYITGPEGMPFEDYTGQAHGKSLYERILEEPEQSYERASQEIPQLTPHTHESHGRYLPLSCEGNRQEFALRHNGHVFMNKHSLKVSGRDTSRLLWPGPEIRYRIATGDSPDFRERDGATRQEVLNGYLPVVTTSWEDRGITYQQEAFACLISESPWDEAKKRGDEPVALMMRLSCRNMRSEARTARIWMPIEPAECLEIEEGGFVYAVGRLTGLPEHEGGWVCIAYPERRLRLHVRAGAGTASMKPCAYDPDRIASFPNALLYEATLRPGETDVLEVAIPFITFTEDEGKSEIAGLSYEAKKQETIAYWEAMVRKGAHIRVPEKVLNEFNQANRIHIAITADKDVLSGLTMLPAATYGYNVCANEACHQIRSLDVRGDHERARRYLTPFVRLQGTRPLHGRFRTQEGVLHGLRVSEETDYQTFNYNLDHGFVLWTLAEHYKYTRDRLWLEEVAPNLVAACDFLTRERAATRIMDKDGHPAWGSGLMPPGHLEDNPEWLSWYAVNAYAWRGMAGAAEALGETGHPEAARISEDAALYGEDIRKALAESRTLAPVVRLRDGTAVPHQPTRCYLRGRDIGWIRDALYGPVHLIDCGLIPPDSPEAEWILKDHEDNIYPTAERGLSIDLERFWFSQGGITLQANLLPGVLAYLKRDQPAHALRAFYNTFASHFYPDVRCFTEWLATRFGFGGGPFYKTPDESAFIVWLRHLLVMETGDTLRLATATPRPWLAHGQEVVVENAPSYFGPVSFRIESGAGNGRIVAEVAGPRRNPPRTLELRLRHPEKLPLKRVRVDGRPYEHAEIQREIITFAEWPERMVVEAEY